MSVEVEGLDDLFSIMEAARTASESISPIVHGAIVEEFRRRKHDIPRSDPEPGSKHVSGSLMKSLTRPNDRLHYFNVAYYSGRLDIEVGSYYRGARFQIRRIPRPVAQRVNKAVFEAYKIAVQKGHLPRGMDVKSVRNIRYRRDRDPFGRRKYTPRLTRRRRL